MQSAALQHKLYHTRTNYNKVTLQTPNLSAVQAALPNQHFPWGVAQRPAYFRGLRKRHVYNIRVHCSVYTEFENGEKPLWRPFIASSASGAICEEGSFFSAQSDGRRSWYTRARLLGESGNCN